MDITELGGLPLYPNVLESPVGKLKKLGVTQMAGSRKLLETSSPFWPCDSHLLTWEVAEGRMGISDQDSQVIEQHFWQTPLAEQACQVSREEGLDPTS